MNNKKIADKQSCAKGSRHAGVGVGGLHACDCASDGAQTKTSKGRRNVDSGSDKQLPPLHSDDQCQHNDYFGLLVSFMCL